MIGALRNRTNRAGRGFTLVELLVVVLILAILMAVALPLYLNAIADSEKKTCRTNMQTIANAVQAARVAARASDYSAYVTSDISTIVGGTDPATHIVDLQAAPKCPGAGTKYSVTAAGSGFTVACDVAAHGSFTPGVDNK